MSLPFILLIIFGYVAGISAKIINHSFNYVFVVYIINIVIVSLNIVVYIINKRYDAAALKSAKQRHKELSGSVKVSPVLKNSALSQKCPSVSAVHK